MKDSSACTTASTCAAGKQIPRARAGQPDNWKLNYDGGQKDVKFDQNLWSEKEYGDFTLIVDWRQTMEIWEDKVQVILPDGSYLLDDKGAEVLVPNQGCRRQRHLPSR